MLNTWGFSMVVAGACSAGAILLIREIPRVAGGIPSALTVALYMLLGGVALLLFAAASQFVGGAEKASIEWPALRGASVVAGIGILLAVLELFFVSGARQSMPMPDAMIVYNFTSLALLAIIGIVLSGESLSWTRFAGLSLGIVSMLLLLQPAKQ